MGRAPHRRIARAALVVAALVAGCGDRANDPLPHVRLGMSPRDVRTKFEPGGEGQWQVHVGNADDTELEWSAATTGSRVAHARFEFHLGMLVAMRANVREPTQGERVVATSKIVMRTRDASGGSEVTVLARDCPTHRAEAEQLAATVR